MAAAARRGGSTTRQTTVFQWAQVPGPVGGVTRCVDDLSAVLAGEGVPVERVNTGSGRDAARMLPRLWRRRSLHLFHITRLWRAIALAPLYAVLPGRTVLVLHSGSTRRQVEQMGGWRWRVLQVALHAYDELWAVNDEIGRLLPQRLRDRVRIVSPFVAVARDRPAPDRDPDLVTVANNSGEAHYGGDLALEAMTLARQTRPELRLWILAYGNDGARLAALRSRADATPWVRWSFNLSAPEVADALSSSAVFLRPTSWDGDALIVREALAAGARVVASDTAARPEGVELSELGAEVFAAAVLHGGRRSDGAGLADTPIVDATRGALADLQRD